MKTKEMKTREQKDKAAKKGKQSLSSVTRRFQNFSISKIDLTPPHLREPVKNVLAEFVR